MVMIITQTSRERQFQFTAWGLMPVSISSVCFVNVFQAAQMYHYYAVKNNSKSVFVSVTCWRTCQNMQRSISHGHRNLEIHIADQTHTHTSRAPWGTIFYTTGQSTYPNWCSITKPFSCTLPGVCVRVWVKQTRQFRLRWSARSDPAPAPRGYPSVPLSRCGKAKCWMGYPVAPAWLLGSRQLNQSQIGLWAESCEYIFLRLRIAGKHRQPWTCRGYSLWPHYNVDITHTSAPTFKYAERSAVECFFRSFTYVTLFFSFSFSGQFCSSPCFIKFPFLSSLLSIFLSLTLSFSFFSPPLTCPPSFSALRS